MSRGEKGETAARLAAGVLCTAAGLRPRFLGAGVPLLARVEGISVWSARVTFLSLSGLLS